MGRGTNQKLKLVYLIKILMEKTDDEHSVTMSEILSELKKYDIAAERKSIYADLESLRTMGIDIIGEQEGKSYNYRIGVKQFELAELKLLVDAIQSSKFITEKKSNELIKKLEGLASVYEAKQLQRQVVVSGRIKTMNESIYYNVDEIHAAIGNNRKIRFKYFQWNIKKEMELRRDGEFYEVSPWALSWDDENYYMIGYDSADDTVKHYRVDKMRNIQMLDEDRDGREHFRRFNMAAYARKSFGMFGGEEQSVRLRFDNSLAGVVIDRFGKDIMIIPFDEDHFTVNVDVAVSGQFFGWIFALGKGVKILGPENVEEQMKNELKELYQYYKKDK